MGGSSGGSTTYEKKRIGVDRRRYGEVSETGFTSREQYDKAVAGMSLNQDDFTTVTNYTGEAGGSVSRLDEDAWNKATGEAGLTYDSKYNRWSLSSGVDLEAAKADWENYTSERKEIATYDAKEARRKATPGSIDSNKKVDYNLTIKDDKPGGVIKDNKKIIDTSPSTASTSQALGIY